ncbi:uncharacterized protein GGS22DRAFT_187392 [Annulohypoxylon maeteangense]|uniref:uncharacterized protein n=1 Tax=Annulohypoxylon maeteangense TaxID=1927788 RepID=UPI002008CB2C|nr:uncharacterized protein GGS22DRAFT_187392 [Annulohypoxylon maeteangense]KAI0886157.1 hypothetical protein GGS22DRAFT_187392 [Annulohypoxylon maeteangense]
MSQKRDSAVVLDHPADQVEDADMDDSQQKIPHKSIGLILGSEITYEKSVRIRRAGRDGEVLLVRLPESLNDDCNIANPPFKSMHWVVFNETSFRNTYRSDISALKVIMLPLQENKDIILRACSYMIAKKNRMYLEFRGVYTNGIFESNEPSRFESAYKSGAFISEVARAALKPRGQRLKMIPGDSSLMSGILLLASFSVLTGELQFYHPESESYYKGKITRNDIILWESEEALDTLYVWIMRLNAHAGSFGLNAYRPESEKTKRDGDHANIGPAIKKGQTEIEAKDEDKRKDEYEDDDMMDIYDY